MFLAEEEELRLTCSHVTPMPGRTHMIIAQQMQNSMYEQAGTFLQEGFPGLKGLSLCRLKRDNHIAKKRNRALTDSIPALREGHHIR